MAKHTRTPWRLCEGNGRQGFLPDEVPHRITWIRFAVMATPEGVAVPAWRWVCNCRQLGPYSLVELNAGTGGDRHIWAMRRREE
jgi:hypothetical protein